MRIRLLKGWINRPPGKILTVGNGTGKDLIKKGIAEALDKDPVSIRKVAIPVEEEE